ncbi:MAG: F0F1 ATP synthase subunit B [Phyllobacterium sp.]
MFVTSAFAASTTEPTGGHGTDAAHGQPDATHSETGVPNEGGGVFPPFDSSTYASQVLWLAITFGLFYLILSRFLLPRIGGTIETRHARIAQDLDQAARMKQDSDAAIAAYEQELAEAKQKAGGIAQTARDAAKTQADGERAEIEATLEKKLGEAETRIAAIKSKAMHDVGTIAEDTATEIVNELLGGKVGKADVSAAVKAVRG